MHRTADAGLARQIRLPQAVALYVGSVLGSGVLLIPGYAADAAGPSSVLVWLLMSLLALPMALTLGILSARHPDAGGVSAFVRKVFGPAAGAVAGWLFLASVPIGATVAALAAASYVQVAAGLSHGGAVAIAALILGGAVVNNYLGAGFLGRSQVAISGAIVVVLAAAVAVAAPHVEAANFTPFAPRGVVGMGQAAALMFWCFIGWEAVTHLAEEFTDPRRDTIRAILVAALVVGIAYTAVGLVTVGTGSYGPGVSSGALAAMVSRFLGPWAGLAIAIMAVFICLGTINAYVGAASRLAFALAREGAAPAFLATLHPTRRTPHRALLAVGGAAGLVLLLQAGGGVGLDFLLSLPNATFIGTYVMGSLAAVRLLRGDRWMQALAWISLVMSCVLYAFLGWAALYTPLVGGAVWLYVRRRAGR
ncbi:MAG: amino acid permease [Symbiobacteriaceae bacterium]|nr:amino acid permease [Symbiobacteriaceae bacterium]